MSEPNEGNVNPQDLLFMIGELTVENRLLRGQLMELKGQTQKDVEIPTQPSDVASN